MAPLRLGDMRMKRPELTNKKEPRSLLFIEARKEPMEAKIEAARVLSLFNNSTPSFPHMNLFFIAQCRVNRWNFSNDDFGITESRTSRSELLTGPPAQTNHSQHPHQLCDG